MAHPSDYGLCNHGVLRLVLLFLVGVCLVCYMIGPQLHNGNLKVNSKVQASCGSCACDCPETIISIPLDCGKHNRDMNEEMEKDVIALLSEELSLQKSVTNESLEHTNTLIMGVKKSSSHYQKEAEKCNSGMGTCEGAREKAEADLIAERKLSALWEKRAYELGWKDKRRVYTNT